MTKLMLLRGALLASVSLASACAHMDSRVDSASGQAGTASASAAPARPIDYNAQTLSDLLVAEVAAQRDALAVTMGYYGTEARKTNDPAVLRQAARLAAYLEDPQEAATLGEQWLEQDPGSREAHEILALSYVRLGETDKAADHIDALLQGAPDQSLMELVAGARGLGPEGNRKLLTALGSLTDRYPDQAPLWYARALTLQMEDKPEEALKATNRALRANPRHEDALLLKARLMFDLGDQDGAIRHLEKLQRKYPEARRVSVQKIRLLIEAKREEDVRAELTALANRYPDDQDLRYSMALLSLEQGMVDEGQTSLEQLLEEGYRQDDVHLVLGQLAEREGNLNTAIRHYLSVNSSDKQFSAQVQATRLMGRMGNLKDASLHLQSLRDLYPEHLPRLYALESEIYAESGQPERAMKILNQALSDFPDASELLYARAMIAEKMGNLGQLEADLRRVLELEPGDTSAMNALGYTLADRTTRFEEAHQLVAAAYEKEPDDPAIIDSMGWVMYRLGRLDEALDFLQRAWKAFPDPEVAAHLGEVLWQLGQQAEARRVWQESLKANPDNPKITSTVERLTGKPTP